MSRNDWPNLVISFGPPRMIEAQPMFGPALPDTHICRACYVKVGRWFSCTECEFPAMCPGCGFCTNCAEHGE
jgi:hypothetical protein